MSLAYSQCYTVYLKVIRRWVVSHMRKTAFVIEHDFVMASACSDRCLVYSGRYKYKCIRV